MSLIVGISRHFIESKECKQVTQDPHHLCYAKVETGVAFRKFSKLSFLRVSYFCHFFRNIHPDIYGRRNSENAGYSERKTLSKTGNRSCRRQKNLMNQKMWNWMMKRQRRTGHPDTPIQVAGVNHRAG